MELVTWNVVDGCDVFAVDEERNTVLKCIIGTMMCDSIGGHNGFYG